MALVETVERVCSLRLRRGRGVPHDPCRRPARDRARNRPSPSALLDAYRAEQRAAAERLSATPVAELPSIAAWRRVFTRFGAEPTRYRNAAEALLRRLAKHGDILLLGPR